MKKKALWISGILVVAVVAGVLAYRAYASNQTSDSSSLQTATVERGALTASLSASGNTRSGQSATIVWQTSGKVDEVALQPGDVIQEDQVLAALDTNTLSTR
jgi:multidrug efflux pump subunit AcrA (membrane-fusion protein)